ncbi:membrane lipoprotein [Halorhabdus tiamatea SARL4B]|uniref:Membrane lipoprotein n=1 Tax=Halorhabdus tiamatea SARL4B TaxID=1033806 RepID=U2E0I1_9EURY|nr:hypothetical protein [Halorhabdus tiamatea]ERJ05516.1 membrane lipoprotein [Halorhabdus tiamatea SARL4B]
MVDVARRTLIIGGISAVLSGFTGCLNASEREGHSISVLNLSNTTREISIVVKNSQGETIFDREYQLTSNTADENRRISGSPANIGITTEDGATKQFEWAPVQSAFPSEYPDGCSEPNNVSLRIEVGGPTPDRELDNAAQGRGDLRLFYGCASSSAE